MDRPINADLLAPARTIPLPASPPCSPITTPKNVANFLRPHLVLSAFWPNEPLAWFCTAEAQFRLNNITDSQHKYDYALSRMPDDVILQLLDLMDDLEGNNVTPEYTIPTIFLSVLSILFLQYFCAIYSIHT